MRVLLDHPHHQPIPPSRAFCSDDSKPLSRHVARPLPHPPHIPQPLPASLAAVHLSHAESVGEQVLILVTCAFVSCVHVVAALRFRLASDVFDTESVHFVVRTTACVSLS